MELIIKATTTSFCGTNGYIHTREQGKRCPEVNYTYCFLNGRLTMMIWQGNTIVAEQD